MTTPPNDLEQALHAACRSEAALPDFYRRLLAAELWCVMPYHPELVGGMDAEPGKQVTFVTFQMPQGVMVPLFTSPAAYYEAMKVRQEPPDKYAVARTEGGPLLKVLANQALPVVLNPYGDLGMAVFDTAVLRKLADGTMLKPVLNAGGGSAAEDSAVMILDVADHPTKLVQAVFEHIREREIFRAAWVFGTGGPVTRESGNFRLVLWMARRDAAAEQDLGVVLLAAQTAALQCDVTVIDTAQKEAQAWTRHVPPFFMRDGGE